MDIKVTNYHSFCNFIDWNEFQRLLLRTYTDAQMSFWRFDLDFSFFEYFLLLKPLLFHCNIKHQGMCMRFAFLDNKMNSQLSHTSLQIVIRNVNWKNTCFSIKKLFSMFIQDYWNQLRNWIGFVWYTRRVEAILK